jgi:hypothetical protein
MLKGERVQGDKFAAILQVNNHFNEFSKEGKYEDRQVFSKCAGTFVAAQCYCIW